MTWSPIALTVPQYADGNGTPYSGAVLKAYAAGTSTPITMATDSTGGTTVASMALNAAGNPAVSGNVVIPHLAQSYKLSLYPTQAAAAANSGAIWTVDNLTFQAVDLNSTLTTALAASSGSSIVGHIPAGTGTVATTVGAALNNQPVSVFRFMTPLKALAVQLRTGVVDVGAEVQAAWNSGYKHIHMPQGVYSSSIPLTFPIGGDFCVTGDGIGATVIQAAVGNMTLDFVTVGNPNYLTTGFSIGNHMEGLTIDGVNLQGLATVSILAVMGTYNNTFRNVKLGIADVPNPRADLYLKYDVYTTRMENVYGNQLRVSGIAIPYCTTLSFSGGSWTSAQIYSTHALTMTDVTIQGTVAGGYNANRVLLNNVDTFNFIGGDIEGTGTAFKITNSRKVFIKSATCAFNGADAAVVAWIDADTSSNISSSGNYFANWSGGAYSPTTPAGAKYYVNGGSNTQMELNDFEFVPYYTQGSWIPAFIGLTVVNGTGGATYAGTWQRMGNRVYFNVKITVTGTCTTEASAGATRHDLPVVAVDDGVSSVVVGTAAAGGTGLVMQASQLSWMPAWTAANSNVVISGRYLVS